MRYCYNGMHIKICQSVNAVYPPSGPAAEAPHPPPRKFGAGSRPGPSSAEAKVPSAERRVFKTRSSPRTRNTRAPRRRPADPGDGPSYNTTQASFPESRPNDAALDTVSGTATVARQVKY